MTMFTTKRHSQDSIAYRMVVLGSPRVGKTSLISMFLRGEISQTYTPTVEDYDMWRTTLGSQHCLVTIIDTSGCNEFPGMRRLYVSTAHIFLLVHSLEDPESFQEVLRLLEQIKKEQPEQQPLVFVVGNKSDRRCLNSLTFAEAELLLVDYLDVVRYFETDARSSADVEPVFAKIQGMMTGQRRRICSAQTEFVTSTDGKKNKQGLVRKWKSQYGH